VQVQTRDQKSVAIFSVETTTAKAVEIFTDADDAWVELVGGVPALASTGQLVTTVDREGSRRLYVDGAIVTPAHLQVRAVLHVGDSIVFQANHIDSPWTLDVWRCDVATHSLTCLSSTFPTPHSVSGIATDSAFLLRVSHMTAPRAEFVTSTGHGVVSHTEEMLVAPNVAFHTVGKNNIPVAIVTPRDNGTHKLPVLFDPYGGPHAQRVVGSLLAYATSQWFADQGFVVVVADGRGTPGKGSSYERSVLHDLAGPVLDDQVEVAQALTQLEPRGDVTRVAIRGWSFGGYLAALAVLRRPDIFHCAVAGAPVTDWRLYDTHYTERYLGNPAVDAGPYESTSLMNDARLLKRPLLLIHGLADDNVVAAHTLQLSSALLAAGKDHEVLPLSGVTHMTPQEVVAENLLLHQLSFIQRSLPAAL
jgi:dipeptidyl-peptidase-4